MIDAFTIRDIPSRILAEEKVGQLAADGQLQLDLEGWYLQEAWLRAFKRIAAEVGQATLKGIGRKIPEHAVFPPWVTDIHSALKSIDIAYHLNHRKEEQIMFDLESGNMLEGIGHYGYENIEDEERIVCKCENPYPCTFDEGIIETMASKFEPNADVYHLSDHPCRQDGGEFCIYEVTW